MDRNWNLAILCVIFGFLLGSNVLKAEVDFSGRLDFDAAAEKLAAKNTLKLNDQCNPAEETKRMDAQGRVDYMFSFEDFSKVYWVIDELNKIQGPLCNLTKDLQCNPDSGLCDCGNASWTGTTINNTVQVNGICRIAANSNCIPVDKRIKSIGGIDFNLKCEEGYQCALKDGSTCTLEGSKNFTEQLLKEGKPLEDICVCTGGSTAASLAVVCLMCSLVLNKFL